MMCRIMNFEHDDAEYVKRTALIENQYDGEKCKDSFKSEIMLKKHINTKHSVSNTQSDIKIKDMVTEDDVNYYKCDKCESSFISGKTLNKHMNTEHTLTRIEKTGIDCNICGKCFWTEHEIILHMDGHMRGI